MKEETRERMIDGSIWLRGLHMLLFTIAYNIAEFIIVLIAIYQFFCVLITGRVNEPLLQFGNNLTVYAFDILQFVTFNTEAMPFPIAPWPNEEPGGARWTDEPAVVKAEFEEVDEASVEADEVNEKAESPSEGAESDGEDSNSP